MGIRVPRGDQDMVLLWQQRKLTDLFDDVYGYALFSDDCVSSLGMAANRLSTVKTGDVYTNQDAYRYLAVEWSEWDNFGFFDDVNAILAEMETEDSSWESVNVILRLCLDVLCELESEGVFGPRTDERFIAICLSDSDKEIMNESVRRLNTPRISEAYQRL